MNVQSTLKEIPLTKLVVWEGNVRKTGIETGLDELTASIAAHGLLNPLTVTQGAKGKFPVIAGQRRLLALKALAKAGTISKAYPVACVLRDDEGDPAELSLAENVVRVAMHPADQFTAWRGLVEQGHGVPEIAARFGVTESTVRKRLALASVSPVIFALYRDGEMSLEALQAFTLNDDHAMQESVWQSLSEWQKDNPSTIRRALTETDIPCADRRVIFVGLEVYEAAGGAVRRDLFNPKDGGFLQDAALLDRLVAGKLEEAAATVQAEGWLWTEVRPSFNWEDRSSFQSVEAGIVPLSDEVQTEAEALEAEAESLDGDDDDEEARLRVIQERLDQIDTERHVWTDADKAQAGAVLSLDYGGSLSVERGLIRKGDAVPMEAPAIIDAGPAPKAPALSAALVEELTAHKTAALRVELARSPAMALALTVHALALSAFYHEPQALLKAGLVTRSLRPSIKDHDACRAVTELEAERSRILDRLPADGDDLLSWCLTALQDDLLDVLAVASAHGLDAVVGKSDANTRGSATARVVAEAMQLDMAQWYRPTAEGYFGRISKAMILADLAEARQAPCAPSWETMKKAELAVVAEREIAALGWLPGPMR